MLKSVIQDNDCESKLNSKALVFQWIEQCVIGLSLCPYARAPVLASAVRLSVCESCDESTFLQLLLAEARELRDHPEIETTLVVAADGFGSFLDFNDFFTVAESALVDERLEQDFQLANFHPDYLFAGDSSDDPAHFTNRAPFPIIQLLRVSTVSRAIEGTDTLSIPQRNCERLRSMKSSELLALFPWSAHWLNNAG